MDGQQSGAVRVLAAAFLVLLAPTLAVASSRHSGIGGSSSGGGSGRALLGAAADQQRACAPAMLTPRRAAPPTGFRFLHIPKTGTSFIITLRNQLDACKHKDISCMGGAGGGVGHYEHGKKVYSSMFFENAPPGFDPVCGGNLVACQYPTYHKFYDRDFQGNNPSFAYVTLIREPVSHVISMTGWKCASLVEGGDREAGWRECLDGAWSDAKMPGNFSTRHDPQTKLLAGVKSNGFKTLNEVNLTTALTNLLKLDFFGVTDRWTESICLFHATFGGEPRPSQFLNVRPGESLAPPAWVVERVRANTVWDRRLYAVGAAAFQCRVDAVLASDRAASYTACVQKHSAKDAGTPAEPRAAREQLPFSQRDAPLARGGPLP